MYKASQQLVLRGQCGMPGRERRGCQKPGHLFVESSGPPGLIRLRIRRIPLTWLQDPEGRGWAQAPDGQNRTRSPLCETWGIGPLIQTVGLAAEPSPAVVTEGLGSASVNAGGVKINIHNYSGPRWELGEETLGPQLTPAPSPPMAHMHAHCPARGR